MLTSKHVMVDLETMDNKPTSAITAIGAVEFNPTTGEILDEFYTRVDLQSSIDLGLTVSGDTINWWLKQNDDARLELAKPGEDIRIALDDFSYFFSCSDMKVWGNGASFDNAILAHAYSKTGIELPWKFWNDRCYRTLKNLYKDVPFELLGTAHNALDDAKSQALHLVKIMEAINGKV